MRTEVSVFPLTAANEALEQLRAGFLDGAIVLSVRSGKIGRGFAYTAEKPQQASWSGPMWLDLRHVTMIFVSQLSTMSASA